MKRMLLVLVLLALMATGASADYRWPHIGLYADEDAVACQSDFPVYAYTNIYVCVYAPELTEGITAAEFLIDGIDGENPNVIITPSWNSPLTIGDAIGLDNFSIAFTDPALPNTSGVIVLGHFQFFPIAAPWPPADSKWGVIKTYQSGKRLVVDHGFQEIPMHGVNFWPACDEGSHIVACACGVDTPTENTSWGSVKSLY